MHSSNRRAGPTLPGPSPGTAVRPPAWPLKRESWRQLQFPAFCLRDCHSHQIRDGRDVSVSQCIAFAVSSARLVAMAGVHAPPMSEYSPCVNSFSVAPDRTGPAQRPTSDMTGVFVYEGLAPGQIFASQLLVRSTSKVAGFKFKSVEAHIGRAKFRGYGSVQIADGGEIKRPAAITAPAISKTIKPSATSSIFKIFMTKNLAGILTC